MTANDCRNGDKSLHEVVRIDGSVLAGIMLDNFVMNAYRNTNGMVAEYIEVLRWVDRVAV